MSDATPSTDQPKPQQSQQQQSRPQQQQDNPRPQQQPPRPQQQDQGNKPKQPEKEKLTTPASTAFTDTHFTVLKSFLLWVIAAVIVPFTVSDLISKNANLPYTSDPIQQMNAIINGILMSAVAFLLRGTKSLTKKDIALFIPIIPTMLAVRAAQNDPEIRSSDINNPKQWKPVFTAIVSVLSVFGVAMLIYHFHYVLSLTKTETNMIEFLNTKLSLGNAKLIQYLLPIILMALWNGLSYGIVPRPYSLATLFLTLLTVFNIDTYISKFVAGMAWGGLLQTIIP